MKDHGKDRFVRKEKTNKEFSKKEKLKIKDSNKMMTYLTSQKAASMEVPEVVSAYNSNLETGLSSQEATRRKKTYGLNDLDVGEDTPLWKKYLNQVGFDSSLPFSLI